MSIRFSCVLYPTYTAFFPPYSSCSDPAWAELHAWREGHMPGITGLAGLVQRERD